MIVTMTVVRMVNATVDQIVDVVAVRDCLVSVAHVPHSTHLSAPPRPKVSPGHPRRPDD
jgi:hypothetical protein